MRTRLDAILDDRGRDIRTIHPEASVIEAVCVMNRERVGVVLVLDGSRLVGIFTERDVLTRVIEGGRDAQATAVKEVMTTSVVSLASRRTVGEAMAVTTEKRCRHLPVYDSKAALDAPRYTMQ